ncbi:hypothetical protein GTW50_18370 [Streptomyces sp. SID7815]|uniref:HNH endonuclease n=1 Tax=Streptomyces pratensis (strain ATCC 33331 / IAF-45CD) TaxID=591167 RepID=A0A8D3WMG0_STRFA|nr:hypothetical protein [Streptomyces sp. SID7815]MYT52455.1 hypothetical protein [Streptomyces sp. SID7815]
MSKTAYIYVPAPSKKNLEIGLDRGLWGWKSPTLDRATGRPDVQSLEAGDYLVLAHIGPQARVPAGGWANATLKRVIVTQITQPYFQDTTQVWPDDTYPERIGIDLLADEANVTGQTLGDQAAEALRLSANKQGSALVYPGTAALAQFVTELPTTGEGEGEQQPQLPNEPETVTHSGADSALVEVLVRREQSKLRKRMLGGADTFTCALCRRHLPVRFIRAAHIKRRSQASREERLQLSNIMPACLLGCDELFEHGYIHVTDTGHVAVSDKAGEHPALKEAAGQLAGNSVGGYSEHRAPYFAWHRSNIVQ